MTGYPARMAETMLTSSRQSDLLALLRGPDDWPTKKAALVAFPFAPVNTSEGPLDTSPPTTAPNSWDELQLAVIAGIITRAQLSEVLAARYNGDAATAGPGDSTPVTLPPDDPNAR